MNELLQPNKLERRPPSPLRLILTQFLRVSLSSWKASKATKWANASLYWLKTCSPIETMAGRMPDNQSTRRSWLPKKSKITNAGDSNKLMLTPREEAIKATTLELVVAREITVVVTINQSPFKISNKTEKEERTRGKINKNINLKTEAKDLKLISKRLLRKISASSWSTTSMLT